MTDIFSSENETTIERSRRQIDDEINALESKIRALKSQRNMLSHMSRLPPELIARIFLFCASNDRHSLHWIKTTTHVCSHWRTVAFDYPALWSTISLTCPQWVPEMLTRSKMASLDFILEEGPKDLDAIRTIFKHVSRIRTLHITVPLSTVNAILSQVAMAAPILESLTFDQSTWRNWSMGHGIVPDNLFSEGTPVLRNLALLSCQIDWKSSLFRNITSLTFADMRHSYRPTTDQLITVLENMPLLESLTLTESLPVFPHDAVAVPIPHRVVDLLHLSDIRVESSVLECANLFNHISFPGSARLNIHVTGTDATLIDFTTVFASLSTFISSKVDVIHNLSIRSINSREIRIVGWAGLEATQPPETPPSPPIDLSFTWSGFEENATTLVMTAVCNFLPLTKLSSLRVSEFEETPTSTWTSIFGSLPMLRSVALHTAVPNRFISALVSNDPSSNIYFSTLQSLTLRGVIFNFQDDENSESDEEEERHAGNEGDRLFKCNRLLDCLIERYEQNAEIRTLTLAHCYNLDAAGVELLKEIIVDVVWDGFAQKMDEFVSDSEEEFEEEVDDYDDDYDAFGYSDGSDGANYSDYD